MVDYPILAYCPNDSCSPPANYRYNLRGARLFFPPSAAEQGTLCPYCRKQLALARVSGEGTIWLSDVEAANEPLMVPLSVPSELRDRPEASEAVEVLHKMLAASHRSGLELNGPAVVGALANAQGTKIQEALRLVPDAIRGKLALSPIRRRSRPALDWIDKIPGVQTTILGGKFSRLDWAVEAEVKDSIDLMLAMLPDSPDATHIGIEISWYEAALVNQTLQAVRSALHDPGDTQEELLLVAGPDKVHAHLVGPSGGFLLVSAGPSGEREISNYLPTRMSHTTASVLAEFEELINRPGTREATLEAFLREHSHLLFNGRYEDIRSQLTLRSDISLTSTRAATLRPDFFVREPGSSLWDIVELKRADVPIFNQSERHLRFSTDVQKGVSQLRVYYDFFQEQRNRDIFFERYRMEVFEPNLTLVIGKQASETNERLRRRLENDLRAGGRTVDLVTYDELARIASYRNLFRG